jgi:hypothetical protein
MMPVSTRTIKLTRRGAQEGGEALPRQTMLPGGARMDEMRAPLRASITFHS